MGVLRVTCLNVHKLCTLLTEDIYVLFKLPKLSNRDYFPTQIYAASLSTGGAVLFLRGINYMFTRDLDEYHDYEF